MLDKHSDEFTLVYPGLGKWMTAVFMNKVLGENTTELLKKRTEELVASSFSDEEIFFGITPLDKQLALHYLKTHDEVKVFRKYLVSKCSGNYWYGKVGSGAMLKHTRTGNLLIRHFLTEANIRDEVGKKRYDEFLSRVSTQPRKNSRFHNSDLWAKLTSLDFLSPHTLHFFYELWSTHIDSKCQQDIADFCTKGVKPTIYCSNLNRTWETFVLFLYWCNNVKDTEVRANQRDTDDTDDTEDTEVRNSQRDTTKLHLGKQVMYSLLGMGTKS